MINKLSSPFVSIICGAIWLAAFDLGDAKGKEKDWITLDNCRLIPNPGERRRQLSTFERMTPNISSDFTLLMLRKRRASVRSV